MTLHPIFQHVVDSFMPPAANEGLRPIGDTMANVVKQMDTLAARKAGKSIIQNLADMGRWDAPPEDSERYRMLDRALGLRSTPWRLGGSYDGSTVDGWSYVRLCAAYATQRDCIDVTRLSPWGPSEAGAREALSQWGLTEIKLRHAQPGDVLLFNMPDEGVLKGATHVAVMSAPGGELSWAMHPDASAQEPKILHAYPVRAAVETWLGTHWSLNLIAAYSFGDPFNERPLKAVA